MKSKPPSKSMNKIENYVYFGTIYVISGYILKHKRIIFMEKHTKGPIILMG